MMTRCKTVTCLNWETAAPLLHCPNRAETLGTVRRNFLDLLCTVATWIKANKFLYVIRMNVGVNSIFFGPYFCMCLKNKNLNLKTN